MEEVDECIEEGVEHLESRHKLTQALEELGFRRLLYSKLC